MPARAELRIVGQVEVTRADGVVVTLPSPKAQAVAARLVIDRGASGTSREELAAVVWPDGPPDTWGSALRSILTRVRRFLDDAGLSDADVSSQNGRYVLRLPLTVRVDLERLERVAATPEERSGVGDAGATQTDQDTDLARDVDEALRVTTRAFLPDNDGPWARTVRERIDALRSSCLEASSRHAERTRDPSRAVTLALEAVEHSPLRESAHRALMRAHALSGNRADALAAYHRCKAVLAEEIGVPPSRETTDLYLRFLGEADPAPTTRRTPHGSPFVGRGPDLEVLGRAWDEARSGATRFVLVTGEAGIGRTRLLQEFVRRTAGSDDLVVWCHGRGSHPARPALQAALAFLVDAGGEASSLGGASSAVALAAAGPLVGEGGAVMAAELREALLEVTRTHGPVLLLVDDIDEFDEVSLVAMRDALVEGGSLALALVATAELSRVDPAHRAVVRELEQATSASRRSLRRLGVVAAHDLAWQLFEGRSDARLDAALSGSGGNPYLMQLLTRDEPDAPAVAARERAVADDVDRRLHGLGSATLTFVAAAAVAGARIEVDLVRAVAGLDEETAHDVVRELLERDLVVPTASPGAPRPGPDETPGYAFAHGVVRDVVYGRLSPAERRRLHAEVSEQIWTRRAPGMAVYSGWLAHHLQEGRQGEAAAVDGYLLAAAQAEREGAAARSAELYAAALALLPADEPAARTRVESRLGLALWHCGDSRGVDHLTAAVYDAVMSDQLGVGLTAATALVDGWVGPSALDDGSELATHGRAADEDAKAMLELMAEQLDGLAAAEAEALGVIFGRFLAHAVRLGVDVSAEHLRRGIVVLTRLLASTADPRRAADRLRTADDLYVLATVVADEEALFVAADHGLSEVTILGDPGPLGELTARWEAAAAVVSDRGLVLRRHRERELALSSDADPDTGDSPPMALDDLDLWPRQLLVNRWLQRAVSGLESVNSVEEQGDHRAATTGRTDLHQLADRAVDLALGGREAAARHTVAMAVRLDTRPVDALALHSLAVLAIAAADVGADDHVQLLLERLEPVGHLVSACGYRTYVGPVALHQGRLAARLHRYDDAERHLLTALTTAAQLVGRERWVVLIERELATVLESRGRRDDASAAADLRREADQLAAALHARATP